VYDYFAKFDDDDYGPFYLKNSMGGLRYPIVWSLLVCPALEIYTLATKNF
jgi:hypothetical protein